MIETHDFYPQSGLGLRIGIFTPPQEYSAKISSKYFSSITEAPDDIKHISRKTAYNTMRIMAVDIESVVEGKIPLTDLYFVYIDVLNSLLENYMNSSRIYEIILGPDIITTQSNPCVSASVSYYAALYIVQSAIFEKLYEQAPVNKYWNMDYSIPQPTNTSSELFNSRNDGLHLIPIFKSFGNTQLDLYESAMKEDEALLLSCRRCVGFLVDPEKSGLSFEDLGFDGVYKGLCYKEMRSKKFNTYTGDDCVNVYKLIVNNLYLVRDNVHTDDFPFTIVLVFYIDIIGRMSHECWLRDKLKGSIAMYTSCYYRMLLHYYIWEKPGLKCYVNPGATETVAFYRLAEGLLKDVTADPNIQSDEETQTELFDTITQFKERSNLEEILKFFIGECEQVCEEGGLYQAKLNETLFASSIPPGFAPVNKQVEDYKQGCLMLHVDDYWDQITNPTSLRMKYMKEQLVGWEEYIAMYCETTKTIFRTSQGKEEALRYMIMPYLFLGSMCRGSVVNEITSMSLFDANKVISDHEIIDHLIMCKRNPMFSDLENHIMENMKKRQNSPIMLYVFYKIRNAITMVVLNKTNNMYISNINTDPLFNTVTIHDKFRRAKRSVLSCGIEEINSSEFGVRCGECLLRVQRITHPLFCWLLSMKCNLVAYNYLQRNSRGEYTKRNREILDLVGYTFKDSGFDSKSLAREALSHNDNKKLAAKITFMFECIKKGETVVHTREKEESRELIRLLPMKITKDSNNRPCVQTHTAMEDENEEEGAANYDGECFDSDPKKSREDDIDDIYSLY